MSLETIILLLLLPLIAVFFILSKIHRLSKKIIYVIGPAFSGKSKCWVGKYLSLKICGTGSIFRKIARLADSDNLNSNDTSEIVVYCLAILRNTNYDHSHIDNNEIDHYAKLHGLTAPLHKSTVALAIDIRNKMRDMQLIPDQWVIKLINHLLDENCCGMVFDGVPRSLDQAQTLPKPHAILHFTLPKETLLERAAQRECEEPTRVDNDSSGYEKRIESWLEVAPQILGHFESEKVRVITLESTGPRWLGNLKTVWAYLSI